jgi:general secretion pathway protein J
MIRSGRAGGATQSGFTLLEILVALTVLAFLMVGLTQGVRFGLQAWDVQARTVSANADLDAVDRTLRLLITQADPGVSTEQSQFKGDQNTLAMATRLPETANTQISRDADVRLLVDGRHRMILRWLPHPHAERLGSPIQSTDTVMISNVDHLEFAYWQPAPQGGGGWAKSWTTQDLPLLVRVRIVFVKGDPRHWPEVIAAPMLSRLEE